MAIGFTNISNGGGVKGLSAHPQDVRMGMTYSVDGKTAETGTMNLTNLLPENIRKGVNIAGVVGSHTDITEEGGEVEYKSGSWVSITSGYQATVICMDLDSDNYQRRYLWKITVTGLKTKPRGVLVRGIINYNGQRRHLAVALADFCYVESNFYEDGARIYNGGFEIGIWLENGYNPPRQYFNKIIWETYN